ncbi:MAG TPA: zinc-binding dehydrogenase [Acidimicrobiales bacterium]|nr:zinc-binding dehydrogenase [Acidimicrobiales bacterium]
MNAATVMNGTIGVSDKPEPTPGRGELLVCVRAAGLNAADLMQVAGFYPAPPGSPPDIPGMEIAGEVAAVGADVTRFAVGDRVMALLGGGGQAELAVVHERVAMPVPAALEWAAAGGFPETFTTAFDALFTQCELAMGDRALIHGAAGGVGTAAVQLAAAAGAVVTATVRNAGLRDAVADLGAHRVVAPDEFAAQGPFDVILELVGATNMAANLGALAIGGRISVIGVGAGANADINLLTLMAARGRIHGSTLRARPLEDKASATRAVEAHVLPLVNAGRVRVPVAATFPLAEAAAAYERFAAGGKLGKLVLLP